MFGTAPDEAGIEVAVVTNDQQLRRMQTGSSARSAN